MKRSSSEDNICVKRLRNSADKPIERHDLVDFNVTAPHPEVVLDVATMDLTTLSPIRQMQENQVQQKSRDSPPEGLQNLDPIPNIPLVNDALAEVADTDVPATMETVEICQEIYHKLRAMFPNLQKDYLKSFCPAAWIPGVEHDTQFGEIVDKLISNTDSWQFEFWEDDINRPSTSSATITNIPPTINDIFSRLSEVFPDAAPHYLQNISRTLKSQKAVEDFVVQTLKNHNYPTHEQYKMELKKSLEMMSYTNNFCVEDFLKTFPDPFKHFENPDRVCKSNSVAETFLKNIFNLHSVNKITSIYRQSKFNMSIAAKALRQSRDFIHNRRRPVNNPTEDIAILQEIAFIVHHNEICSYIKSQKLQERKEIEELRAVGGLLQCQCCYNDECIPRKCANCDNGHIFCNSCIIKGTDSKLGDGETHVQCFLACGSEFSLSTLQNILAPKKYSIFLEKRQAAEVMAAGLQGLVSCPFCYYALVPVKGDKVFKCRNPECMKESCIACKELNHVPLRCDEFARDKARKYVEEKMTQALTRTCYKCKKPYIKEEGCNFITCPCGATMCFICNEPIKDHSHFRGSENDINKCPAHSDSRRLNIEVVRRVAEEARNEVLRADPTLNINTQVLAPALPPPRNLPGIARQINDTGVNRVAAQLAARVMRDNRQ